MVALSIDHARITLLQFVTTEQLTASEAARLIAAFGVREESASTVLLSPEGLERCQMLLQQARDSG